MIMGIALSTLVVAQSEHAIRYNLKLHEAGVQAARGDHPGAFALYDSAFANIPWGLWEMSEAATLAIAEGDTTQGLKFLAMLYARGGQPLITYSAELKGLLARGFVEPELSQLLAARKEWEARADSVWIQALNEMRELDQSDRDNAEVRERNDRINLERLITLSETRGFPIPANVGSSFGIVHLLLWHHRGELGNSERVQHFISLARSAMDSGTLQPDFLCMILDFEDYEAQRPMRFGSLTSYFQRQGNIRLVGRAELNHNRASVGLESIEDFALLVGLDLDALTQP